MNFQSALIKKANLLNDESTEKLEDERQLLIQRVRRWGGSSSDAILDPVCKIFTSPTIEGLIGYRVELNCVVVFGDPICAPIDRQLLVQAFHDYYKESHNIIYVMASEEFSKWGIEHGCRALIEFGQELIMDPHADPRARQGTHASLVRRKVRHALRAGVQVKEYVGFDKKLEEAITQVGISWLQSRRGPQVYISHVRLFADRFGKRWFYAQQGDHIVGVLLLNQLQAQQGWLLNHLMITPDAQHGTPELLVVTALETLQQESCHFVTFGSSPAKQLGQVVGLSKSSAWLSRQGFKLANKLFHLHGHNMFWEKFHPESKPTYLLFHQSHIGWRELLGLSRALNVSL